MELFIITVYVFVSISIVVTSFIIGNVIGRYFEKWTTLVLLVVMSIVMTAFFLTCTHATIKGLEEWRAHQERHVSVTGTGH